MKENMTEEKKQTNFIRDIIDDDLKTGKHTSTTTRFPPEPNGYLHIGHAKSICLNFGIAEDYPNGVCNLRFDDTNPTKEDDEYVQSIKEDVKWLGFDWEDRLFFASDYFDQLYEWAVELIKNGNAFVCDLIPEEMSKFRGTPTQAGKESPFRNRTVKENLDLFERMKNGEFPDGSKVLRAKIGMTSSNMNMRDPVMYRILHTKHHRTGNKWCIYPMYDWAHGLEDSIEGVTHSLCTLEFEDHRPLYNWIIDQLDGVYHPRQIEFARLSLNYTVMSKRKLKQLVDENHVSGWDDPRMPTISGLRRRGFTPEAIRDFSDRIGVAKRDNIIDYALLEHCLRDNLNKTAHRYMAVLDPLKVVITNYPENHEEDLEAVNNPEDENAGKRTITFTKEIYIEKSDFMEDAPKKFFRLSVGREVRLKHAFYITCTDAIKNEYGEVTELHCTYDPATKGGWSDDGRKVKGTLHWVSAKYAINAEIRMYDHLFNTESPEDVKEGESFLSNLNQDSLVVNKTAKLEPALQEAKLGQNYQFLRNGYFILDYDTTSNNIVFNKTVGLRDSWAKKQKNR